MSPDLDQELCNKYPTIFRDRYSSAQQSCMYWGLEVGDGWYSVIDLLCESLSHIYSTSIELTEEDADVLGVKPSEWQTDPKKRYFFEVRPPNVIANQVKEKFGGLRFYYRLEFGDHNDALIECRRYPQLEKINESYRDYIDGIVHFAEILSGKTCSITGKPGQMCVRNGWFKVLSPDLLQQEEYKDYVLYRPV